MIISSFSYGNFIEQGKQVIDDYYKYSMEKNIDSYVSLFDQNYLKKIYGEDYKALFEEVFNYFEIGDYNISYQYYTESEESMTVFFNLKGKTTIDWKKVDMDNDLVAFFTKDNNLKLKYIILQEEFVGQMNKEFVYNMAIWKIIEKNTNLKDLAKKEWIEFEEETWSKNKTNEEEVIALKEETWSKNEINEKEESEAKDYKSLFEKKIAEHEAKHSSSNSFWIWGLVLIVILVLVYKFTIKKDRISNYIKNEKTQEKYLHIRESLIKFVDKSYIFSKKIIKKWFKFFQNKFKKK